MPVWISTDSNYVKKGIIERVPKWQRNCWTNAQGKSVANQAFWGAILLADKSQRKIEWTWVKAHGGILLSECADMLATKGVNAEPMHPGSAQFVVPAGKTKIGRFTRCGMEKKPWTAIGKAMITRRLELTFGVFVE
jgi:ribonuclease HI